jgi:predicted short-subunit dehydrogenase-like oxidoreductase (DUF2520 family)
MQNQGIVILGAGKVAQQLYLQFLRSGIEVSTIWARNLSKATIALGTAPVCNQLSELPTDAHLYIICVSDGAIAEVAAQLPIEIRMKRLVVHTSGATPMSVLAQSCKHFGVFYPLQTFSASSKPDWTQIPICVHANSDDLLQRLQHLASRIAKHIYVINDEQRLALHVAAVFVNNFSNYLFHIGATICETEGVSFDILKPLIAETIEKLKYQLPKSAQTGPAIRNDVVTIARHEDFLSKYPTDFQAAYQLLTNGIKSMKE